MKLVIFGSTGSMGHPLVVQALEEGHTVTAFARNPAKLEIEHANLTVVQGDVLDSASLEMAVDGQDAVLCSLGAGAKGTIRSEGTRNIVRAMEKAGVSRFVCLSTLGVGKSRANLSFFWKHIMFGLLLRRAYADHVGQEGYVKESRLDWTIVRPGAFTDGNRTGVYRHGFPSSDKTIKGRISRADVADFMLKQLTDGTYLHETPGLSY
jgi:putative NADH-flavin reductase